MNWERLLNSDRLRPSERAKTADARNEFESDFGRVIFSPAVRRMHDKTQVFPLTADDNIHSRLTHSMEVMSIGHSLGIRICEHSEFKGIKDGDLFREIPEILKSACLVHDIGNPPFGHFGESVIKNYFEELFKENKYKIPLSLLEEGDFTKFDGNAQGFRVLTKLQVLDDEYGLNLTHATLAAYLKYPNSTSECTKGEKIISRKKRGVFQSEDKYLKEVVEACNLNIGGVAIRHPLCYLMEAADSICYSVMDVEDGFNTGLYSYNDVIEYFQDIDGIKEIAYKLETLKANNSKMVQFRIKLIQRLVILATDNFVKNIEKIYTGTYNNELIYDDETGLARRLQRFSIEKIFPSRDITSLELTGHSVLSGLLDYYIGFTFHREEAYRKRAQSLISKSVLKIAFLENGKPLDSDIDVLSPYYKLRVIVDFISGMTDQFALKHYQELSGQKIK